MPSVADMLAWRLPPILIVVVLLLQFSPDHRPNLLHFSELFSGEGHLSKALRRVSCHYSFGMALPLGSV